MKKLLAISVAFVLAGCGVNPPTNAPAIAGRYDNACLPEAIEMVASLKQSGIQAKVLCVYTDKFGHALACYLYPVGENRLWLWDSMWKSNNIHAYWDDADGMAKAWLKWNQPETTKFIRAEFLQ